MTIKKQENRDEITLRTATDGAEIFDAIFHVIKTRTHFERVARSYIDDNGDVCGDCHIYFTTADGRDVLCSEGEHVQVSLLRYAISGEIGTAYDEFIFGTGARFVVDDDALWVSYDGDKDDREPVDLDALDVWTADDEKHDVEASRAAYNRYIHTINIWDTGRVERVICGVERVTINRAKHVDGYWQDIAAVIEYTDGTNETIALNSNMWIEFNDSTIRAYSDATPAPAVKAETAAPAVKAGRAAADIMTADENRENRKTLKTYTGQGDNVYVSTAIGKKMKKVPAVSTDVASNLICRARACSGDNNMTCSHCFACGIVGRYDDAAAHYIRNFEILTTRLLSDIECIQIACTMRGQNDIARIEANGDVYNVIQARNYLRVIKAGSLVGLHFGVWTKNPGIYKAAIKYEGRPDNMTFILSSLYVDIVDAAGACKYDFVDAVFTVYSTVEKYNAAVAARAVACKCDTGSCNRCRHCYSYRRPIGAPVANIAELLR